MRSAGFSLLLAILAMGTVSASPRRLFQDDERAAQIEEERLRREEAESQQIIDDGQRALDELLSMPAPSGNRRLTPEQERQKTYLELRTAASQLANVSRQLRDAVNRARPDVASVEVFEKIAQAEKLLKDVKSKAKGR